MRGIGPVSALVLICGLLLPVSVHSDEPAWAPPFLACHSSLNIKGVPTCTDQKQPQMHPKFWSIEICKPNECILRVYEVAPASAYAYKEDPPCGNGVSEYTKNAVATLLKGYIENPEVAEQLAGRAAGPLTSAATELLRKTNGLGDLGRFVIQPYADSNSVCVPLIANLPSGSTLTRVVLGASDTDQDESNGVGLCGENARCKPRPYSNFEDFKITRSEVNGPTAVSVIFKNWRHDKGRRAVMVLWFTPPPSKSLVLRTGD